MRKIFLSLFIICLSLLMFGCKKSSNYSEKEHIDNVSKIIEEEYLNDGLTYKIRPLYDYNDKLAYFVVDFSDNTFIYIMIQEKDKSIIGGTKLYIKDCTQILDRPWSKCKVINTENGFIQETEKDENGNEIINYQSHFEVANISDDTKCYLIEMFNDYHRLYPAIKEGGKYINLITNEELDRYSELESLPSNYITFISKKSFDL